MRGIVYIAVLVCGLSGKDRTWTPGEVVSVVQVQQRWVAQQPGGVEYTIRVGAEDYIVRDQGKTYFTPSPKIIIAKGDRLQVSVEKSHLRIQFPAGERRLRIARKSAAQ